MAISKVGWSESDKAWTNVFWMKRWSAGKAAKAATFYISDYITQMNMKTYEVVTFL